VRKAGTVVSFSNDKGFGIIKPDEGEQLRFESSAVKWRRTSSPIKGQRLSYLMGVSQDGAPRATDLQAIDSASSPNR
jgi:cold shock CspA family protein